MGLGSGSGLRLGLDAGALLELVSRGAGLGHSLGAGEVDEVDRGTSLLLLTGDHLVRVRGVVMGVVRAIT